MKIEIITVYEKSLLEIFLLFYEVDEGGSSRQLSLEWKPNLWTDYNKRFHAEGGAIKREKRIFRILIPVFIIICEIKIKCLQYQTRAQVFLPMR